MSQYVHDPWAVSDTDEDVTMAGGVGHHGRVGR